MSGRENLKFAVVELLDQRLQVVPTSANDFHFPLRVLGGIAGVSGVNHDVLAEFATDCPRRGLARVGWAKHAADFGHGLGALVHDSEDFLQAALRSEERRVGKEGRSRW